MARQTESWVYIGRNHGVKSNLIDEFILIDENSNLVKDDDGNLMSMTFKRKGSRYIFGGIYEMDVERSEEKVTRYGSGKFIMIFPSSTKIAEWRARDRAIEAAAAQERMAKKSKDEFFESWSEIVAGYATLNYLDRQYFEQSMLAQLSRDARAYERANRKITTK